MWRAIAVVLGFFAVAWLEFEYVPGHSYLAADSRLYVTILQHLAAPGYLSRDLIASHPNVTYTAFDEITLFLHRTFQLNFRSALLGQEFVSRCAGLLGLFLLSRSAGLRPSMALAASAMVNLGTYLPGIDRWLINREPVPPAFALGPLFLAFGCLARGKPLLAGFSAGICLLYDPVLALPFWAAVVAAAVLDRIERRSLRPMLPILLIFVLLLANLAQLQPGAPDPEPLFGLLSAKLASIQTFRLPSGWVSHWPRGVVSLYVGQFVVAIAAVTRLWPALNRHARWIFIAGCLFCLSTVPFSGLFIDSLGWSAALRADLLQILVVLTALSWLAAAVAGFKALSGKQHVEGLMWLGICALFGLLRFAGPFTAKPDPAVSQLASWAHENTWGDSLFLFPGADRSPLPSTFRALSQRGLWVDWASGEHINSNSSLAYDWSNRWKHSMKGSLNDRRLQNLLKLPIDYLVLMHGQHLASYSFGFRHPIAPAFADAEFQVYDVSALRFAPGRLALSLGRP